jgi:alginate O-acetyltransferase complex protein AlgI
MSITAGSFWTAAPLVVLVYYLVPRRLQNVWLLLVSYAFVLTWAWQFAVVLFTMTVLNFALSHRMWAAGDPQPRLLWLGIGVNVLTLVIFRSSGFFLGELLAWWGRVGFSAQPGALTVLVPVGLAYYTLQNVSYLVDVYRGHLPAERSFIKFALYLAYFPKFLAGPIERPRSFLPQVAQARVVDSAQLARSVMRLVVGAARKLFIADTLLATIPGHIWAEPRSVTAPELWLWLLVYAAYLYNDFAGYTSLIRGVSGLFGIELSSNFDAPFFARTFSEFWSRWHISLSQWLRDYIFYPLSRWLRRRLPTHYNWAHLIVPPLVTMSVSGLWHGFNGHILVWGGLHGLFLAAEQLLRRGRRVVPPDEWPWWRQILGGVTVTTLVTLAWVPFRLELPATLSFWKALVTWTSLGIHHRRLLIALALMVVGLAADWAQSRRREEFIFLLWPRLAQAGLMALILFGVWILSAADATVPFVYQGF